MASARRKKRKVIDLNNSNPVDGNTDDPRPTIKLKTGKISGSKAPEVPEADHWFRAPFFADDKLWKAVEAVKELPADDNPDDLFLVVPEVDAGAEDYIPPSSVMRLGVEGGHYPYSRLSFPCRKVLLGMSEWTAHVLATYQSKLLDADIVKAIECTVYPVVRRNVDWISCIISRWSIHTHTFVFAWGESTPTLEDVHVLLGLSAFGGVDMGNLCLNPDQEIIYKDLVSALKHTSTIQSRFQGEMMLSDIPMKRKGSGKNTWAGWIQYWFKDMQFTSTEGSKELKLSKSFDGECLNHRSHLAAYIALWLSRYVFEGSPADGVRKSLFSLAAILATGKRVSLAPLFLGTLYRQLDLMVTSAERSMGRYDLFTYINTSFLMAFLFERFPLVAPRPCPFKQKNRQYLNRIDRWGVNSVARGCLSYVMDSGSSFTKRPYVTEKLKLYSADERVMDEHQSDEHTVLMYRAMTPCSIPCYDGSGNIFVTHYSAHRVARQFGCDQGAPSGSLGLGTVSQAFARFHSDSLTSEIIPGYKLVIPSSGRVGEPSSRWMLYWKNTLDSFEDYICTHPSQVFVEPIYHDDKDLSMPQSKYSSDDFPTAPHGKKLSIDWGNDVLRPIGGDIVIKVTERSPLVISPQKKAKITKNVALPLPKMQASSKAMKAKANKVLPIVKKKAPIVVLPSPESSSKSEDLQSGDRCDVGELLTSGVSGSQETVSGTQENESDGEGISSETDREGEGQGEVNTPSVCPNPGSSGPRGVHGVKSMDREDVKNLNIFLDLDEASRARLENLYNSNPHTFRNVPNLSRPFRKLTLTLLADTIQEMEAIRLEDFSETDLNDFKGIIKDLVNSGLDVGWIGDKLQAMLTGTKVGKLNAKLAELRVETTTAMSKVVSAQRKLDLAIKLVEKLDNETVALESEIASHGVVEQLSYDPSKSLAQNLL